MRRFLIQLLILGVVCGDMAVASVVKGVVVNCDLGPRAPVSLLEIRVFDTTKVPRLAASIKALESPEHVGEKEATRRLDAMIRIGRASTPLGQIKTDRSGLFRIEIPNSTTKIIIFGYGEREDYPYFYTYQQASALPRSTVDLALEIGQYCTPVK